MPLCFLVCLGAFFALNAAHATGLALICLAMALFMLHPVRALVLLCLGGVVSLVVAVVNALLPSRYASEWRELDVPPAPPARHPSAPASPTPATPTPATPAPASPAPGQRAWYGQASPFLDYRGRHIDEHKPPV